MNYLSINFLKKSIFWGAIVFYLVILSSLFNISFFNISKFLLLNIISIFLPGFVILSSTKIDPTRSEAFFLSYLFGYAFLVIEYFFSRLSFGYISFTTVTYIVSIVSTVILFSTIKKQEKILSKIHMNFSDEKIFIFFFILFLFFNIFGYAANYLSPEVSSIFNCHRDIQYWVNNTVSLKLSWPADFLFMSGVPLNYHYFSNIPIAFLCDVYNLDVFSMSFPLYALTKTIVMVGAVHFLLTSITHNPKLIVLGYLLLTLTTGLEYISVVTLVHHTLLAPFGFDIGYGYGILFVGLLLTLWNNEKFNLRLLFPMLLVWSMCVGAKAPIASVLIFLPALLCFFMLVRKEWVKAFGYGIPILVVFFLICKYCVGMFTVIEGQSSTWELSLYNLSHLKYMGLDVISKDPLANILVYLGKQHKIFGLIFRTLFLNPLLILCGLIAIFCFYHLIKNKTIMRKKIYLFSSLLLTGVFGLGLWHAVNAGGASEMYFAMAAIIPITSFVIYIADCSLSKKRIFSFSSLNKKQKLLLVFISVLAVMGVGRYSASAYDHQGAFRTSIKGIKNLYKAYTGMIVPQNEVDLFVCKADVEALSWIRNYSEPNSLIMTDKAILLDNNAFYIYGIFTERQQYLEGTDMISQTNVNLQKEISRRKKIIKAVYSNKDGSIETAKNEGVNYIVQTISVTPDFVYDKDKLELVEDGPTIKIFKVK